MDSYNSAWSWSGIGLPSPLDGENVFDFSSLISQPSFAGFEDLNSNHEKTDVFAEWMDEKVDLPVLDGLECQPNILDDLDAMVEGSAALLNLMDWPLDFLVDEPLKENVLQVPSLSPPVSPSGKVPDISFALSPEFKHESFYVHASSDPAIPAAVPSPGHCPLACIDDPLECVKVEIGSPVSAGLDCCPTVCIDDPLECVKVEIGSPPVSAGLDCCLNTPPQTPTSLPNVELAVAEIPAETNVSIPLEETSTDSPLVLDSPINSENSDTVGFDSVSSKDCNSGDTSLPLELKAARSIRSVKKCCATRVRAVPSSDPLVPVEIRRKERKRVQNKDAATRYREKKRKEAQSVMDEESALEQRNKELHGKFDQLSNEISYLKGLLKEAKMRAQAKEKYIT